MKLCNRSTNSISLLVLTFLLYGLQACAKQAEDPFVEVTFRTMQPIPGQQTAVVILKAKDGQRYLPIYIDENQAVSIYYAREGEIPKRPLTHDLFVNVMKNLDARLERVVITELRDGVYYANLVLQRDDQTLEIDSRPSDAIALALRTKAPIYAHRNLLEELPHEMPMTPKKSLQQMTLKEWGITVQELTAAMRQYFKSQKGVLISDVQADSPAAKSGLEAGDLLIQVQKNELAGLEDFRKAVRDVREDAEVKLVIWREGERKTVTLRLK